MRTVVAALSKGAVPSAIAVAIAACSLKQIDAVAPLTSGDDATAEAAGVGTDDGAADVSIDTTQDGPSSLPCSSSTAPLAEWTFDATTQGWTMDLSTGLIASLTWTSSTGNPTRGALQVDFTTPAPPNAGASSTVWMHEDMGPSNFTGRTLSAWAWLDSGPSPRFLTYAQTGTQYEWADDGEHTLALHAWTCVSLPLSKPTFNQPNYDTTQVIRIGFEMISNSPFRVFIDTVRVQ
jgi:hypothetical protein